MSLVSVVISHTKSPVFILIVMKVGVPDLVVVA